MALIFSFLTSSGYKKKEPRCVCLREAKASLSHKMWTEVSSSVPHFLQVELLLSPLYICIYIYIYVFSRCLSSKQANKNPGLCRTKGQ